MGSKNSRTPSSRDDTTDVDPESAGSNGDPETYRARFDDFESPSIAVASAVRDATDAEQPTTPPLYDAVDPDALDSLFCRAYATPPTHLRVSFRYLNCAITVRSSGEVTVRPE